MAGKSFSVSFNINGSLDGSLQAALNAAANAMRGLGNSARAASNAAQASKSGLAGMAAGLNQLQAAAQRYKQIQDALRQANADFSKSAQNLQSAKAKYEADTAAVEKLKQKIAELKAEQSKIGTTKSSGNATLKQLRQDLSKLKQAYEDAKKAGDQLKMSSLGAQIKSTQNAVTAQQDAVRKMAQSYKELSDKVKQAKTELAAANTAAQTSGREYSAAKSNNQRLYQSIQSQQAALGQLKAQLSAAGFSTSSFASSESRLAADIDRVNAALQRQQQLTAAQSASNQASQNMFNAYNNFQGALSTASSIAQPFQSAIENAMTFEHAMSRVKALTQTSNIRAGDMETVNREMALLEGQARELGATTQFTMTQAADAMGYLGMAGWKTEQIYGTMPGMLNLAAGAGTDLARTADIVSDNMTAMQVPVEKAGHFMDVYAYALTNSNVNLESLGETMKYAAPVAAAFGASLEDTAAMTMMMGNAGIKGSMAGTALRMGLLRLSGPPKKASKAMDELGISVSDATAMALESEAELARLGVQYDKNAPPMEKMGNIITQLSTKMQGLSREEKLSSIGAIFGANAASGWVNIIEQGPEVFNEYLNALKNCDGYSEQFAHTMNDDTRGAMIALESAVDAVINSIGTALLPAVRSAAEAFAPMATAAAQFIAAHPGIVQAAAGIAAALATVVVGAAAVKLAFAGWTFITSSITLVRAALATLADGAMFGGLIARLAALRTAFVGAFAAGGLATTGGWATLFAGISAKATAAAAAIRTFFASLTLGSAASGIVATLSSIGTAIAGAARAAMAFVFSPVGVALMALALAGLYCYQNWDKVSAVFGKIAGIITGALSPALNQVKTALNALSSSGGFATLSSAASQAASVIGGTLVKAFAVVLTGAASAIAGIVQLFADLITVIADVGTGLSEAFSKIADGDFSGAADALLNAGSKALTDLEKLGTNVVNNVEQSAKNVSAVIDALNSNATATVAAGQSTGSNMATGLLAVAQAQQPQAPPIDTSATQAALDQVGSSASNAASQMQAMETATAGVDQMSAQFAAAGAGVEQLSTSAQTAGTGVQEFATNAQQAGTSAQQMATSVQNAATGADALGNSAQNATGGIEALSSAASGATGGVSALGSAASGAAGSVSGLGAAVQAACSQLAQAGASAAAAVASAGGGVKANYAGGIYPKGQFLTTFAEKSPEAAIPIDNSNRARELWTKTGQMLGMLPGSGGGYDSAEKDAFGNVVGMDIPEYNRIGENDTEDVKIDKRRVQREQYEAERARQEIIRQQALSTASRQIQEATQTAQVEAAQKVISAVSEANIEKDELGNIRGIDIPEYNRITAEDSEDVKIDKRRVQREQYERERAQRENNQPNLPKVEPVIQQRATEIARATNGNYPRRRPLTATSSRRLQQSRGNAPTITTPTFTPQQSKSGGLIKPTDLSAIMGQLPVLPPALGDIVGGALTDLTQGNSVAPIERPEQLLPQAQSSNSEPSTFNFTINVTVNGNADENTIQRGVEAAIPSLDEWSRNFDAHRHEEARRSFL
ncbi:MAG: phage tail tape measure protein [Selenomonadaceae bacterium]|nr:phage tail tape measure protein [Selenomonadaceae bacterium]MBR1805812.1 phage tail tape measure protein [Selenomonadaceae bacterium]